MSRPARHRIARLAIAAVAALAVSPAAAQAACPKADLSNPFAQWSDNADYQLAPDGGLESGGAAWALARGASVTDGNETFQVGGAADDASLDLPAGSTATTSAMCIGVEHRTMRFFVKRDGPGEGGSLKVEVLYTDASGAVDALRIGNVDASGEWAPSPILPVVVNDLATDAGIDVSFRFTPQGGNWSIDDVYVDPARGT